MITIFRGSAISLIYLKSLYLPALENDLPSVAIMSTDIDQMSNGLMYASELWAIIVETGIGLCLLWRQMGPISLAPVFLTVISALLNAKVARLQGSHRGIWSQAVQRRVGLTSTILGSMKSLRLAGMTGVAAKYLQSERVKEINLAKKFQLFTVWQNSIGITH
jgi:ATP-binding cassette, subfamily C (CFTR/MRP), member 1